MKIYKIVLSAENIFVGSTVKNLTNKRFGHVICAKNNSSSCSLYKKIRELKIEASTIKLELLEEIDEGDEEVKLIYWKKREKTNLDECRAGLFIDGNTIIKKSNMSCICSTHQTKIIPGKPFVLNFD